jgi:Rrf2 family transcriptional regulator, iron-sulfur cluster assembly transcription factor
MLKLSTRGEYGVRAMIEIGLSEDKSVTVQEISSRQGISAKYLEHLLSVLRKAGLLTSERGPKGGYRLSRPAFQITLAEILVALEGGSSAVSCLGPEAPGESPCLWKEKCALQDVWIKINNGILELLSGLTLEEICTKQKGIFEDSNMYHI